ncbi:MAG: hypothetical protein HYZ34_08965, partial [Ignavibacteriae bacterium]|nr:hypothetical protein [Ignavibacteriota bacterium]
MKKVLLLLGVFFFVLTCAVMVEDAYAIPSFARKYKTSCTTCHIAIPKRNAFGEAFRRNGYVLPKGDAQLTKEEPVSLGAEGWKETFPDAIWPGAIPENFPLAAYIHTRVVYDPLKPDGQQFGFDMPHELELLFGTAFGNDVGVFGEWIAFESGANAVGLQRFFFQFNDVAGPKDALNIKVGRFEPGITSGYMQANRITLDRPLTIDYRASGDWRPRDNQAGIELNGILANNLEYAAGVLNGEGKTVPFKDRKDVYARAAYKIGGMALDGSGADAELKESDNWIDDAVTIGAYGYMGSTNKGTAPATYTNDFSRLGFDLRAGYDRFEFTGGLITGKDDNPLGKKDTAITHTTYFGELDYLFYPWLIG